MKLSKLRIGLETGLAAFTGTLGLITIFWHDWIEALTGWDPDHHNGSVEWLIVVVLLSMAVILAVKARYDWKRMAAASA